MNVDSERDYRKVQSRLTQERVYYKSFMVESEKNQKFAQGVSLRTPR